MKTDKPFQKSFACAGVLFAAIVIIVVATGAQNLSYRVGYVFSTCLFPAIATGIWGYFSGKAWSWPRFAVTVIAFYFLFAFLAVAGKTPR